MSSPRPRAPTPEVIAEHLVHPLSVRRVCARRALHEPHRAAVSTSRTRASISRDVSASASCTVCDSSTNTTILEMRVMVTVTR